MARVFFAACVALSIAAPADASGRLFVVSKARQAVEVYDADTGKLEFDVKGAGDPHQVVVSPDGRFAFTGDAKGFKNTITAIDVEKKAVAQTLNLSPAYLSPHGIGLSPDGSRLYATCAPNHAVIEMQLSPLKITRSFKVLADNTENLAITPDGTLLFATSSFDGNFAVIDLVKGEFTRSIKSGPGAEGVDVSPDGKEVWVANRVDQTISVVDIAARKRVANLQCVGNPMHVYFVPGSNEVVVTCAVADRLVLFDRAKRTEITRFEVGDFPIELAFGENGAAYVTNALAGDVAVVDIAARKVLRRITVGGDPEGIAYSPK
jgi:YVTN family beta-propeller protein